MTILEFAKLPYIEGFDLDMYTLTFRDIKYNLVEYCESRWIVSVLTEVILKDLII